MAPTFWRRVSQDLRRSVLAPARTPRVGAWASTGIHAAWIGHSTVLLSIDGFTILTDPVFSRRIGPALDRSPWDSNAWSRPRCLSLKFPRRI
jgi:hypothetical protein